MSTPTRLFLDSKLTTIIGRVTSMAQEAGCPRPNKSLNIQVHSSLAITRLLQTPLRLH